MALVASDYSFAVKNAAIEVQKEQCFKAMEFGSKTLLAIVNDILDFSKLRNATLDLKSKPIIQNNEKKHTYYMPAVLMLR